MSQIYVPTATSTPSIPTQFTADDALVSVPVGNNENIFSRDTTDNNDNGIRTTVDPPGTENFYIELTNRATGTVTTSDSTSQEQIIYSFNMSNLPGTFYFYGNIVGFCNNVPVVGAAGTAFEFNVAYRTTGNALQAPVLIGGEFTNQFEEAALEDSDTFIQASLNTVNFVVEGVAGLDINWNILLEYRRVN